MAYVWGARGVGPKTPPGGGSAVLADCLRSSSSLTHGTDAMAFGLTSYVNPSVSEPKIDS